MNTPEMTIIIPTIGRPLLLKTLTSLLEARGIERAEILVVGRIADETVYQRFRNLVKDNTPRIRHEEIEFDDGDSSRKKNHGIRRSAAEIIAFLDDDVTVAPNWPERILETFAQSGAGMVSGPSLVPLGVDAFERLVGYTMVSWATGYAAARYRSSGREPYPVDWDRIIGCNMAYRRGVLAVARGFDPRFFPGEELVAAYAVEQSGHCILFDPQACVYHYPRRDVRGFVRQIWSYGVTRTRLRRYGLRMSGLVLLPAFWVALTVSIAAAALWLPFAGIALLSLLGLYLAMIMVAVVRNWLLTRDMLSLGMLIMIPLMHWTYGLAEWVEFLRPAPVRSGCSAGTEET